MNPEVFKFLATRETAHILFSTRFIGNIFAGLASCTSVSAIPFFQSCLPQMLTTLPYIIPLAVSKMVFSKVMEIGESEADKVAAKQATDLELIQMEGFTITHQKVQDSFTKKIRSKAAVNELAHGSLSNRLLIVSSELRKRSISSKDISITSETTDRFTKFHTVVYSNHLLNTRLKFE